MSLQAVSFRDPAGKCFLAGGRVLRLLDQEGATQAEAFLKTARARTWLHGGQIVGTRRLGREEWAALGELPAIGTVLAAGAWEAVYEHERVPFASYPYEWSPEMLWEAGRLTLELARTGLPDGYSLKDATPYNVLFRGSQAVFIDVPSFETRTPGDPVWQPYAQFVRAFLLPLLANRHWGLRLADIFTTRRDGLEPEEVYPWCGPLRRLRPQVLSLVSIPTWLGGRARAQGQGLYRPRRLGDPERARFVLESLLRQLERSLGALKPRQLRGSTWSDYMNAHSYEEPAFATKERFIDETVKEFKPKRVLDVGANTGHFSVRVAQTGAAVVAVDLDPVCVGALWRRAHDQKLNILPLVVDIARPSPGIGWRNRECPSFLERATGGFDAVMMLALIHHLLVTERIPLDDILRLAAELTTNLVLVEFVSPQDGMFQQLTRGRQGLHAGLDEATFERACAAHFEIVRTVPLPGTRRTMYGLKKKRNGA